jgi:hypothetical protein
MKEDNNVLTKLIFFSQQKKTKLIFSSIFFITLSSIFFVP